MGQPYAINMHKNTKNVFVTIIGIPNAGKSSLLNTLIGEKIAAVTPARERIDGQQVFAGF